MLNQPFDQIMKNAEPQVVDPRQLTRIESMHEGFLYQHLYATGCLILAVRHNVTAVRVERDEDVEQVLPEKTKYIQIKMRGRNLLPSDIQSALDRFSEIRKEHAGGRRQGQAEFIISSNACLSESLLEQIRGPGWAHDVHVYTPDYYDSPDPVLPPPWKSLQEAASWCIEQATQIPFRAISADTLVWKLTAHVAQACTGTLRGHTFLTSELSTLIEQFIVQLQEFPAAPIPYFPQEDEPVFSKPERIRAVVALSGAGKTAWAAEGARHTHEFVMYFNVGDLPSSSVSSALAREIAGKIFQSQKEGAQRVFFPGATGLDAIRAMDLVLSERKTDAVIIIDNAQRLAVSDAQDILLATRHTRWILLAQPSPELSTLESLLGFKRESLNGWSIETIASEFVNSGCAVDPMVCAQLKNLTGGFPLYIRNFAHLCVTMYNNSAKALAQEFAEMIHGVKTVQEMLLERVMGTLSPHTQLSATVLSIPDIPLPMPDVRRILASVLKSDERHAAQSLRELSSWGILTFTSKNEVFLHDAFRSLVQSLPQAEKIKKHAYREFSVLTTPSSEEIDVRQFALYLRMLARSGQLVQFVGIVQGMAEFLNEFGFTILINKLLLDASEDTSLTTEDRFWARDTLTFFALQEKNIAEAEIHIRKQNELQSSKPRQILATKTKEISLAGYKKDFKALQSIYNSSQNIDNAPEIKRILTYQYAFALFHAEQFDETERVVAPLINEYMAVLNLKATDIFAKNPPEIFKKILDIPTKTQDIKRLADALDLWSMAVTKQRRNPILGSIWAHKFYSMAGAYRSMVRSGQDVVDVYLGHSTPDEARVFMEQSLLPAVGEFRLTDYIIPVKAQYAVVLAYCGELDRARAEMKRLEVFRSSMGGAQAEEFENQKQLIEQIGKGYRPLGRSLLPPVLLPCMEPVAPKSVNIKIGRNEKCYCGSGKKYKRCHGSR